MASDQNHAEENNTNKVSFTPEQQEKIDQIVNEAMGRAGKEARQEAANATAKIKELETTIAGLNTKLEIKPQPKAKEGDNEQLTALQSQIDEMKDASKTALGEVERYRKLVADREKEIENGRRELINERKYAAINKAAEPNKFINLDAVHKLTAESVKWDDDRKTFVVMNEKGGAKLNSSYEPMTLEEFYVDYAAKNPWLVRADATSGAGSFESQKSSLSLDGKYRLEDIFGPKSDSGKANALAKSNKAEYLRLKNMARESGLISY